MLAIVRAYALAGKSFFLPGMLFHFLWPVVASIVLWLGVGLLLWGRLARALVGLARHWSWLGSHLEPGSGAGQIATASVWISLYLVSIPLVMVTAVLILEMVALPFILDKVAQADYPHVERRKGGSQRASLRNTLVSFLIAATVAILTLPLWLLPGAAAIISLGLSAWLNYRSFRYDVLMNHADRDEIVRLPRAHRARLFLMALGAGTLTLVPILNLLAVAFTGLSFIHYLLDALQTSRAAGVPSDQAPPAKANHG